MQLAEKSSDVRKNWARFMDGVIHKAPKFVQRNERDVFVAMNVDYLSAMLKDVRYAVKVEHDKEANEYVATMDDFWFVESGQSREEAIHKIAAQLLDYSLEYYNEIHIYFHAPNLKSQFPKITKALMINDIDGLIPYFDVEHV